MKIGKRRGLWGFALACLLLARGATPAVPAEEDWGGYVAFEGRAFLSQSMGEGQEDGHLSFSLQPEYYRAWSDGDQSFRFTPFVRWDGADSTRTHADVRELYWSRVAARWELSVGARQIFWGVTESQHLVDVINQTDLVEDPDGEAKLGQPMVKFDLVAGPGIWEVFLLAGFRERTFPGEDGRLRGAPPVDRDAAQLDDRRPLDLAARWSHALGNWDFAVSHFSGTGREPRLQPRVQAGEISLVPVYERIEQTGLELQATYGAWLWKLEAIRRRDALERFPAATAGFEYTFGDVRGSGVDVGVLFEYLYDGREAAPAPFEDDLFVGARLALNDVQSTEVLVGAIIDRESGARFLNLEASRRLGDRWKLELRARGFSSVPSTDALFPLHRDDYVQIQVTRYF